MLYKAIEISLSALLLVPVFAVLNTVRFKNARDTVCYYVFAVYLSAVYLFVGLPTLQFMRFEVSLTLVPFLPMLSDVRNTLLNILLFMPLGFLLPLLWARYPGLKETVLFGLVMSASIELLQILTYRATDINDIIANTLGTALGYLAFRIMARLIPSARKLAKSKSEASVIFLSVFTVMFFIQPYAATLFYMLT